MGVIPAMLDSTDTIDTKYLFQGNLLRILEAPEPSSIQYEYLDRGFREHAHVRGGDALRHVGMSTWRLDEGKGT